MGKLMMEEVIGHCERTVERFERQTSRSILERMPLEEIFMKEYWEHRQVAEWLKELQALKDKEEQGLLIELPCKVGDTVYALTPFCEICEEDLDYGYTCENCSKGNFVSETKFDYEMIPMFGKVVFLTRSEAEETLAKMGGK